MGKIILLNTPIGNLGDLTPRVLEALKTGHTFAVEDTRSFRDLLNHVGVSVQDKKIVSLHDHSTQAQVEMVLALTTAGDVFLASEAGSPIVSDPAYPLVVAAYERGIKVESYSGVSSPIMALELSGLPPIPFHFHGFLPREAGKRIKIFSEAEAGTHIFFESPKRIHGTVEELATVAPDLEIVVVRELSKLFEQVLRFRGRDWPAVKGELVEKGECVLLFHQPRTRTGSSAELVTLAQEIVEGGNSPKLVAKLLSAILDRPTKEIYGELNRQKQS